MYFIFMHLCLSTNSHRALIWCQYNSVFRTCINNMQTISLAYQTYVNISSQTGFCFNMKTQDYVKSMMNEKCVIFKNNFTVAITNYSAF